MVTAIVKPTHKCNLGCRYCYVPETAEQGEMDETTLKNTIVKVTKFNEKVNGKKRETHFIWHGGEPLIMGLPFFEKIVEIEKPLREEGYRISNGIQSNGTLLNDAFLDFCEEQNDFHIGLSLDGPKEMHDAIRPYKDGSGSFDDVYKAVKLLKKRNEKLRSEGKRKSLGGGIICILNKLNIDKVDELYKFFNDENINIKINPLIRSGRALNVYEEISITPIEYGKAMTKFFDMWFDDPKQRISIDPFELIMGNMLTKVPYGCQYGDSCQNHFVSIGPTGAVYPCGSYNGLTKFYMGDINTNSMEEIDSGPIRKKLKERGAETVKGCNPCEYKRICNAGCMHNAYMIRENPMDKDYYCDGNRMVFKHVESALHKELKKAEVS